MPVADELGFFRELGVANVGAISPKLETIGWDPAVFADAGLRVSNIGTEERVIGEALDFAATVGADSVWCTTGSIGSRTWEEAADEFCARIERAARARRSSAYSSRSSRPTRCAPISASSSTSATHWCSRRSAGVGVVLELACCWYERGLAELVRDNVHMLALVQVSDYEIGTFDTPNRSVIGDGDVPLERLIAMVLDAGYDGLFDLEIIGPRIEAEGYVPATRRSLERMSEMLDRMGV